MFILRYLFRPIKRIIWALIVAYMLALHNVYKEDETNVDDIMITVEHDEVQEDSTPKD